MKNLDVLSKSDPKCEVFEFGNNGWVSLGKTEVLNNNLNPDFVKSFNLKYYFEKIQKLKFVMWDNDDKTADDLIGEFETNVGSIMGAKSQILEGKLLNKN